MAILRNKQYIKIDYSNCRVQGGYVYCKVIYFHSQEDREKEKKRTTNIQHFLNNFYASFAQDIKDNDSNDLTILLHNIRNHGFYKNIEEDNSSMVQLIEKYKNILIQHGLQPEWYQDPIIIDLAATIRCGEYNQEVVDQSMFYNYLRRRIPDATDV